MAEEEGEGEAEITRILVLSGRPFTKLTVKLGQVQLSATMGRATRLTAKMKVTTEPSPLNTSTPKRGPLGPSILLISSMMLVPVSTPSKA